MIEIVILYILNKYDATIYRLSKIMDELFFAFLKSSQGTIIPALKRLEKLGCVEYIEKMSDGGLLKKNYSITQTGKKHLNDLLLSFNSSNPYHILKEAKIAIFCSNVLSEKEKAQFRENLLNILELYKIKLQNGLKNEYITLDETQKNAVKITINETDEIIKLL